MDSKRLLSFLESAKLGSISAAADSLGYTTSAISQLVASLEEEFGIQLLVRTTRGVYVTEEGRGLIPLIEEYFEKETSILDYVSDLKSLEQGQLTITAYPSIACSWLPDVMFKFKEDHPGFNITIMECVRSDIYKHLQQNEAELAFLAYEKDMPYEWFPLADENLVAVLPEDHPLADSPCYPISNITQDKLILSSYGQEKEILDMLTKHGIDPNIAISTYDTPVSLAMVEKGLGVSIINELSAKHWKGNIVKLPLEPQEKITFGIAFKSYNSLSFAAKIFLDYSVKSLTKEEI